jgi:hypothetical protein
MNMTRPLFAALALSFGLACHAQQAVQVSGVILTQDSTGQTIPNTKIQVKGRPLIAQSGMMVSLASLPYRATRSYFAALDLKWSASGSLIASKENRIWPSSK